MTITHACTNHLVDEPGGRLFWLPRCSCGWEGSPRPTAIDAYHDGSQHACTKNRMGAAGRKGKA